ncbi:hypothetical protein BTA51_14145 [Hahella sp. CCB-MM4]|uniref:aromatic ring-hydroxylating oxygenase subunit alpha n=1 Tax=Hahella sp. (strain CCB-MM4) TaxID=1926491 RepID=UPI000BD0274D|nr:aromatic ring-hydroxylating dioxygenase subunit alpha [Hahella sp. CCB-MM4]OZG72666.1 hypothetical protein BTA51_14145 [Hahella sp. CCB-MM4]
MTSSKQSRTQSLILEEYKQGASQSLDAARSLPFAVYHDPEVYQREMESLFLSEWIFVCSEQEIAAIGDYLAIEVAGEAIAVIRGQDSQLRALSNICRHRGTPLLDPGFGSINKNIICPYHAWTYNDQGHLKAAPMKDASFDTQKHCLPSFHLETWKGLVFINLAARPEPLSKRLLGIDRYLQLFDIDSFRHSNNSSPEVWHGNWKLVMENAMESYHLFQVHKPTLETTTPTRDTYYIAGSSEWTLTGGKMVDYRNTLVRMFSRQYPEVYNHFILVSFPPSFVGILTYDSFDWIQVLPVSAVQSQIRSGGISLNPDQNSHAKAFTDAFFKEDREICERVQRGMHSRLTAGGQLFEIERVVVDFHQFLASRLFGSTCSGFFESDRAQQFLSCSQS